MNLGDLLRQIEEKVREALHTTRLFTASGGAFPQEVLCSFGSFAPARASVSRHYANRCAVCDFNNVF
jgi:acetyl-CoA carboxylase beta subunit